MSLFGFGKHKKTSPDQDHKPGATATPGPAAGEPIPEPVGRHGHHGRREDSPEHIINDNPSPFHDGVETEVGPYDGDRVPLEDFDFGEFANQLLDLGCVKIPIPEGAQLQMQMGPDGPVALHIVTQLGNLSPVAFAAPRSAGQWDETAKEVAASMAKEGMTVTVERGTWGNEVVGVTPDESGTVVRVIGCDGPRWMLRTTVLSTQDNNRDMARLARQVISCCFVYRGDKPLLAGSALEVTLPEEIVQQMQAAQQQQQAPVGNSKDKFFNKTVATRPVVTDEASGADAAGSAQ